VSIFKRSKDAAREEPAEAASGAPDPVDGTDASDEAEGQATGRRARGPWDVTEVGGRDGRMDLGALWMRGAPGMELRLEVDQASQQVNSATAVLGESALQLQAFAAPRSAGLWDEIRAEIAAAVEGQGGTAEEHEGELGTHLRTRMPSQAPDGRAVFAPATFVGVDGPRWFLRGVLSGRAAIDEDAAVPLLEVLREVVVVRGSDPMAPRELLPLSLPRDAATATPEQPAPEEEGPSLDPFERGPEITEVR
jgi:hypothetical protein